ncbi:hypothetical protein NW768_006775 [Fusarium equiseti]|uniref:Nucleoside phosphorylase domain-containing protein n=1 Tax=Fusarium equiseti TaxID=61235 RepID=A0ABQ8R978_FUSEQ|nr:hypothetical protein NW768_006775 [Fusarium equiseti]
MSRRRAFEDDEVTLSHRSKRPCSGLTSYDRYTVAWMCALHIEMAAARAMLDEEHDSPPRTDSNSYVLGTIQRQHVVIACLPASAYGTNNAAIVMSNLKRTFPNIDVCLMVGIGGGVPKKADVRLGDIVVGTRVMQYDIGKTINGELQRTGVYKHPGSSILTVISNLRSRHELEESRVPTILKNKMESYAAYGRPTEPDHLFESSYEHPRPEFSCDECDQTRLEARKKRISTDPAIYYGAIASGNQVIKDATYRDKIAGELDVLCFEMEAAGLMDIESCLPIRGICDYSDSHKAKGWQRYAAATAAAYAYELLEVRGRDGREVEPNHLPMAVNEESTPDRRHEQILESLDFAAIDARKTTIKDAHSKTCRWFLKHEGYLAWKDPAKVSEHHGFLWIRGKPGAGKSTIMKFIYLQTRKKDKKNQILTASFFFNARGETLEKTISGMYRSLLLQLFKGFPDLKCVLDDSDILPQSHITCPSLNHLKNLLRSAVLKLGQRSYTCFIDALDECDEQQVMDLVEFFEDLAQVCTDNNVRLRICFSSRHYPYIDIERGMRLTVEDQDGHSGDLESYIESNLRIKDPDLVAELQKKMLVKASGVFLWVVLVVDVLNHENRRGRLNLRKRLEQVPNGLSELFKDILRRDSTNAEELQLCLLWILLSKRPLRPNEYYHALWSGLAMEGQADSEIPSVHATDASDCFNKSVISSSKGLAEITKAKQPTVQFIHESVRDFLIKDRGLVEMWPELGGDWESFAHYKLKRCCDFYFQLYLGLKANFDERVAEAGASSPDTFNKNYPFLEYASQGLLDHADSAAVGYCQEKFVHEFPTNKWVTIVNQFEKYEIRRYTPNAKLLYILADRGYSSLIRAKLKTQPRIELPEKKERYVYPLIAAMAQGHKDSVLALLGLSSPLVEGLDVMEGMGSSVASSGKIRTPLAWACENGYIGVAKLLFQRGAAKSSESGWTLLMYAAKGGCVKTARWLIDTGEDIRAVYKGDSVISLAIQNSNYEVVELLLGLGIDCNSTTPKGRPILVHALSCANDATIKVILENGADIDVLDDFGGGPLHLARSKAIMEALVERGADVNARNNMGQTCLWNNKLDHPQLEFLIKKGADVNVRSNHGETCLWNYVLDHQQLDLLIKKGANVNERSNDGQTCLFAFVPRHKHKLVELLCKSGVDVNVQDDKGDTCLSAGFDPVMNTQTIEILFRHGANANATNLRGQTYLHRVGMSWHPGACNDDSLRILTSQGMDINARDNDGNTPLHYASESAWGEDLLDIWLRHGADINSRNNQGKTPLDFALQKNRVTASKFLIPRGAVTSDGTTETEFAIDD